MDFPLVEEGPLARLDTIERVALASVLDFETLGVMRSGGQELRYDVVPGSGTGDLAGITGALALTIDDSGHSYELTCTLGWVRG